MPTAILSLANRAPILWERAWALSWGVLRPGLPPARWVGLWAQPSGVWRVRWPLHAIRGVLHRPKPAREVVGKAHRLVQQGRKVGEVAQGFLFHTRL